MKTAKIVQSLIVAAVIMFGGMALPLFASPAVVHAATPGNEGVVKNCTQDFFGLEPWYKFIGNEMGSNCEIKCFNLVKKTDGPNPCGQTASDVPFVLLAIVDDLLRIAGLFALGFVFVGAFKYVTSQGSPDATASAQNTIINALVGLVLAVAAVSIVSFIGHKLGS
ncbi:MAG: pilin [Candidatus Saccharimonadales bacterium]